MRRNARRPALTLIGLLLLPSLAWSGSPDGFELVPRPAIDLDQTVGEWLESPQFAQIRASIEDSLYVLRTENASLRADLAALKVERATLQAQLAVARGNERKWYDGPAYLGGFIAVAWGVKQLMD
jgi:hypothetical protein